MNLLDRFLERTEFESYEDLKQNFTINVPENFNFAYDVVDVMGKEASEQKALVWTNEQGGEKILTFGEVNTESNKIANFLSDLGIKKGDRVMIILKRDYSFWYTIMALHKIGAIVIPSTHMLTAKDFKYRFEAAGITAIIALGEEKIINSINETDYDGLKFKISVNSKHEGFIDFNNYKNYSSEFERRDVGGKDPMILYFTSGTTGYPKMTYHNFLYPLAHIVTSKYWHNAAEGELHLTVADTGWAKAVWGKLYGQWIVGSVVFVYDYENFVPSKLLEIIEKYEISTFCAPPTIYRFFIKEDLTKYNFKLRYCTIAGEPLNPEIYHQFYKATNIKLMEGFGQTETIVTLANFVGMEPKPGSMGKPAPMFDIDILDNDGNSCEIGQEGEIVIRIDDGKPLGMFEGYYKDEVKTNSVIKDNIYYTGDTAWKDEDGYFWFVGRIDDVIKSSGYRIGPFEVESVLLEHKAVLETAITAVPDEIRGQIVKATIVLAKGYAPSEELSKELQEYVKKNTAPYKYPRVIEFVKELPKTISGKIRRVQIREQDNTVNN